MYVVPQPERHPSKSTPTWVKAISAIAALIAAMASLIGVFVYIRAIGSGNAAPIVFPEATPAAPNTREVQPSQSDSPPTPKPQHVAFVTVRGNSRAGTQLEIPRTGVYRLTYEGGSYSTYPANAIPKNVLTWLTAVVIFKGNRPLWQDNAPDKSRAELIFADTGYRSTSKAVEDSAKGTSVDIDFNGGQILTFVCVDDYRYYADNPGQVEIDVSLLPDQ